MRLARGSVLLGLWIGAAAAVACSGSSPEPKTSGQPEPLLEDEPPASSASSEPSPALKKAIDRIQAGDYATAKTELETIRKDEPKNPTVPFYLGVAREGLEDLEGAEAAYRESLALDPRLAEAAVNLSALLLQKEDAARALKVIEPALGASPGHEGLLNNQAMAASLSGDHATAARAYGELLKKSPDDLELKALYAEALIRSDQKAQAVALAKTLLGSDQREVLALAADVFGRSQSFPECVKALDRAIGLGDAAELRVRRGLCHHGAGDDGKAQSDFVQATQLDPKSGAAFYYLGQSHLDLGNKKKAKEAFKRAVDLAGDSALGKAAQKALEETQ